MLTRLRLSVGGPRHTVQSRGYTTTAQTRIPLLNLMSKPKVQLILDPYEGVVREIEGPGFRTNSGEIPGKHNGKSHERSAYFGGLVGVATDIMVLDSLYNAGIGYRLPQIAVLREAYKQVVNPKLY